MSTGFAPSAQLSCLEGREAHLMHPLEGKMQFPKVQEEWCSQLNGS